MHGITKIIDNEDGTYTKRHDQLELFTHEFTYAQYASHLGAAPEIVGYRDQEFTMRYYPSLAPWLESHPETKDEAAQWALTTILKLYYGGLAHRDVHMRNLIVDEEEGRVLIIDYEFTTEVDGDRPCYDLVGAIESGIPVPKPHRHHREGVFWNTTLSSVLSLKDFLGEIPD